MAENFSDQQRVKRARQNNFMGTAREIKEIPKQVPKVVKEKVVATQPVKPKEPELTVDTVDKAQLADPVKPTEQLTIKKGFIAGYTEDGQVLFKPFGGAGRLDIVALSKYSSRVADDLLDELAGTANHSVKEGMQAALSGIKALLVKDRQPTEEVKTAS